MPTAISRRAFLGHASALAALAGPATSMACRAAPPPSAPAPSAADLATLTAVAAVEAMRSGDVTAEAYATALLDRTQRHASLNAFRTLDRDMVLAAARAADKARASGARLGLLHGLPIPVKDSVNTAAYPTSNGSRALEHFRPKADAPIVTALLAQGALVMGKTNLHELSMGYTSANPHFGPVRNPYDTAHAPGGSSGGSAAAVAARLAPMAVAEDTGGSIRVPAAWCGICGLRPTFGRYPDDGIMPLTLGKYDQVGAVARTVADLALFDTAITGDAAPLPERPLRGVRLGIPTLLMTTLDAEVERVTAAALARLEEAGATLVRIDMPEIPRAVQVSFAIIFSEVRPAIDAFLDTHQAGITFEQLLAASSDEIRALPLAFPREAYDAALKARPALQQAVHARFREHDVTALVYPTLVSPALKIGEPVPAETFARSTTLAPCCGHPGLVLPAGLTAQGLPVGIEFDGLPGSDRELLALGAAVEKAWGALPAPTL